MKCVKCSFEFEEKELQCSHDIPKYLGGTDKDGRHWLCLKCHKEYERLILKECLESVGEEYQEEEELSWMKELSNQAELLKLKFRMKAQQIKESFYG